MKPKKSELLFGGFGVWSLEFGVVSDSSTKPSDVAGILISFFGILTTPLFWSSRTSTILFLFLLRLKIMLLGGEDGIKRFLVERFIYL